MENQAPYGNALEAQPTAEVSRLDKEIQLMESRSRAQFALTPVGQALKQFEVNQRMGQMYAVSTIVPAIYQKNAANCAIAVDMAIRMNANPLMVMQNLYIVHGNPSWSSKFLVATINTCGRFQPLRYECNDKKGDDYGFRCYTYDISDREKKEKLEGPWVTWKMVKAEGWDKKSGSKWLTMPDVMFRYRAAALWQRMYAPEISMGFNTVEEAQDVFDVSYTELSPGAQGADPQPVSIAELALKNARKSTWATAPAEAAAAPQEPPIVERLMQQGDFEPVEVKAPEAPAKTAPPVDFVTGEIFEQS